MIRGRYDIGLLAANITDPFSNSIAIGAMAAAKKLDVNLIIFPGKYLGLEEKAHRNNADYEYQYNVLFDHAAAAKLDYLIVAVGTIAYAIDYEGKKRLLEKMGDVPLLSIASVIEGYDYLIYDNRSGVEEAVDYLAAQGKKHIGMMVGEFNNPECSERYKAYRAGLEKNGLGFRESYAVTSDISDECRDEAAKLINDNPELDAVVCANDSIAKVIYEAIKRSGKRVGRDIAVVGFDDLPFAAELDPPLASVRADAEKLGKRSVEKAVNFLKGIEDDDHLVKTQFIPRQSSYAGSDTFMSPDTVFIGTPAKIKANLKSYIDESNNDTVTSENFIKMAGAMVDAVYNGFIVRNADDKDYNAVIDIVDGYFDKQWFLADSITKIYELVDGALRWVKRENPASAETAEKLHDYFYRRVSLDTVSHTRNEKYRQNYKTHMDNLFIRDTHMFGGTVAEGYANIMGRLCDVMAVTGYIYIFKEPVLHRAFETFNEDIDWYFKAYSYGSETFSVPREKQRMRAPEVFCNDYLAAERQHIFIVADLYIGEYQYGIALLEPLNEEFFSELEMVTYQLSSAVRTIELMKQQELMLTELHSRNLALEEMSRVDELTQVYNRRGFFTRAEQLIAKNAGAGAQYVICYADMDNLKMVNDSYGHQEGDLSIKLVADILQKVFGEGAVVGRMGGDEFAAIIPVGENATAESILARKEEYVALFNQSRAKPYAFGMSTGILECGLENAYDLRAAIDKADDLLYIAKAKRRKII